MNKILITVIAFGFITGCSVFGSIGGSSAGSTGSLGGSSARSSGGSLGGSSGGSSGGFFGNKKSKETVLEQRIDAPDTRGLIPVVNAVNVDRLHGGAIVRVRGTTNIQGYSDVNLVALNKGFPDENGVITYEFKAEIPTATVLGPTPRSKEVYAGAYITAIRLPTVKSVRVIAAQNQIVVSK